MAESRSRAQEGMSQHPTGTDHTEGSCLVPTLHFKRDVTTGTAAEMGLRRRGDNGVLCEWTGPRRLTWRGFAGGDTGKAGEAEGRVLQGRSDSGMPWRNSEPWSAGRSSRDGWPPCGCGGSHSGLGVALGDSDSVMSHDPFFALRSRCQSTQAGADQGGGGAGRLQNWVPHIPEPWRPAVAPSLGPTQPLTNAGDAILSQHGAVVAEADDLVALGVQVALVALAVAAVQVVLDVHLPVAFHHCGQGGGLAGPPCAARTLSGTHFISSSQRALSVPVPRSLCGKVPVPLARGVQRLLGCIYEGWGAGGGSTHLLFSWLDRDSPNADGFSRTGLSGCQSPASVPI